MAANPLIDRAPTGRGEKSPTDPYECVEWANARLHPKAVEAGLHWVTDGKNIALVKAA